jgi:tetratricopeptide (TPR) repeat protein
MGSAYYGLADYLRAIEYYEKTLALRLTLYPDGVHPDTVKACRNLSKAWQQAGDTARAEEYAKKADEIKAKLRR